MPDERADATDVTHLSHRLPATFAFSQSSLQAYSDCPRRFWLAYVQQLPWPAIQASPIQEHELLLRMGGRFHTLVERAEIGIDPALLLQGLEAPLSSWFDAYLRYRPADLPADHIEIERVLSVPMDVGADGSSSPQQLRLAAKYDLIAAENDGRVIIIDWKTSRRRSDPGGLRRRLQSIVYPYVLVESSRGFSWGPIQPEQVEMRYWFTAAPSQPIVFRYDAAQHAQNQSELQALVRQIYAGNNESDFPKVVDTEANRRRYCNFCVYRSRCNRGEGAGDIDDLLDDDNFFAIDPESALEFTLEDVDELAF